VAMVKIPRPLEGMVMVRGRDGETRGEREGTSFIEFGPESLGISKAVLLSREQPLEKRSRYSSPVWNGCVIAKVAGLDEMPTRSPQTCQK
jgi:hypothetical protein